MRRTIYDPTNIAFGGMLKVYGPSSDFCVVQPERLYRVVEWIEMLCNDRLLFLHKLTGGTSLVIDDHSVLLRAKIAVPQQLDVVSHTQKLSLQVMNVGSFYLSRKFATYLRSFDGLSCVGIHLATPVAVIREYQSDKEGVPFLDGWSVVVLTEQAISGYVAGYAQCPTGGPTRLEVVEVGATSRLLRVLLSATLGDSVVQFHEPIERVPDPRESIAVLNLW